MNIVEPTTHAYDALIDERWVTVQLEGLENRYRAAARQGLVVRVSRVAFYGLAYPLHPAQFPEMNGYGLAVVVALAHEESELPLTRVYLRTINGEKELKQLAWQRSELPAPTSDDALSFGRYRADVLVLFPLHLCAANGLLAVDFARNRTGLVIGQFPLVGSDLPGDLPASSPNAPEPSEAAIAAFAQGRVPLFALPK